MTEHFDAAFDHTIGIEGGYVNDPTDRGGETIYGITKKYWPQWKGWAIVTQAKKEGRAISKNEMINLKFHAKQFYKSAFWNQMSLDKVKSKLICMELFDTAINQGASTTAKNLQHALNLLNRNQRSWSDLKEDGRIGPKTLGILNDQAPELTVWKVLNGLQFVRYRDLVMRDPSQERFFNGWIANRVFEAYQNH